MSSTPLNPITHPVGSRLLVAWLIKSIIPSLSSADPNAVLWEENDQVGEVNVCEYSPSGCHVRVESPGGDNYMHSPSSGWYPVFRIVVKETLSPRQASNSGDNP